MVPGLPLDRLRMFMKDRGLTQRQLGEILGCTQAHVSEIMLGRKRVSSIDMAARIEQLTKRSRVGVIRAVEWARDMAYAPPKSRSKA